MLNRNGTISQPPQEVPPPHISLREYTDSRFAALVKAMEDHFEAQEKAVAAALVGQKEAVAAALAAADRAVAKAEAANEKRFESVNEFRSALSDSARMNMPRAETERALTSLTEKVDLLTSRVNGKDDRGAGRSDVWGWVVAGVAVLSALGGFFVRAISQ